MPKTPSDETKMRTEDLEPEALRHRSPAAAASDGPVFAEMPAARAPAPMRKRGRGGRILLLLGVLAAVAAAAAWYFLFR